MPLPVLLLAALVTLAGCSSPDGGAGGTADPAEGSPGPGPDAAAPAESQASESAPEDPPAAPAAPKPSRPLKWSMEAFDGEVLVAPSVNVGGVANGIDTFTVPKGAEQAWFNLTVSGQPTSEVKARFLRPSGCGSPEDCYDIRTAGGVADQLVDSPEAGEWQIGFFGDPEPTQGTYRLEVNSLVPA